MSESNMGVTASIHVHNIDYFKSVASMHWNDWKFYISSLSNYDPCEVRYNLDKSLMNLETELQKHVGELLSKGITPNAL